MRKLSARRGSTISSRRKYLFPRKLRDKPLDHRPCLPWQRTGTVRTTANLSSMSMQLHYQVRYFLALARTLNFTRAAEQCNVTQPALTKAVHKLEQELGGLIHRERHLTQLTELGKMILPTLEQIFAAAEAVRLQARGYQKKTIAPLKIGLVPSVSAALITELLLDLARIIPDLRVDLHEADANGLVAMLLDGEINAALVGDAVELPERIDRWRLFEERYVLVLSRKHPMARQTVIPLQDLHEVVFLERVGCDVAGRFKQACFADHPGPKVVHRSDSGKPSSANGIRRFWGHPGARTRSQAAVARRYSN